MCGVAAVESERQADAQVEAHHIQKERAMAFPDCSGSPDWVALFSAVG